MRAPLLDRAALELAFGALGDRLVRRGLAADVYVIRGAPMAMAYDARRATRDVDAVFEPHGAVLDEAHHRYTDEHRQPLSRAVSSARAATPTPGPWTRFASRLPESRITP